MTGAATLHGDSIPSVICISAVQLKLHLLCPSIFPPPAMLAAEQLRKARERLLQPALQEMKENSQAATAVGADGQTATGASNAEDESPAANVGLVHNGAPVELPQNGQWKSLRHLGRVVLRPLPRRGCLGCMHDRL
jgi:hypothetical protein